MKDTTTFPILANRSTIPPGFQYFSLDCRNSTFTGLDKLGCSNLVLVDSPSGWRIERSGRLEYNHLDIFFPVTGSITLTSSEGKFTARGGQMLVIPSWYDRIISIDTPCYHVYVSFKHPESYPWLKQFGVRNSLNTEAIASFSRMLILNHSALPEELSFQAHLAECLAILLERELQPGTRPNSTERARELLDMLQKNESRNWSVQSVARRFGMSLTALRNFCFDNFGQSPGELINDIRMSRARSMLTYSDSSIEEIARELGYRDRFIFSKAFTRLNHQSPGKYRKSW